MALPDKVREKADTALEESGVIIVKKTHYSNGNTDLLLRQIINYLEEKGYSPVVRENLEEYNISCRLKSGNTENA